MLFFPFYLQYFSDNLSLNGYKNCYKFVNLFYNEVYCLIVILIIFYLCYKLKNQLYDTIIIILFLLNICLGSMSYDNIKEGRYTFYWVLGETNSGILTHLFFSKYFIGIITGLIYFYHNDLISNYSLANNEEYIPFYSIFILMKLMDRASSYFKKFCLFLSIFIQIILSFSFYFFQLIYGGNLSIDDPDYLPIDNRPNDYQLLFNSNRFIIWTLKNEKYFFLFAFSLMFISILVLPMGFKKFSEINLFLILERLSFTYLCLIDISIYCFYSFNDVQIYFSYQNIFFFTLVLIIFVLVLMNCLL